MFHLAVARRKRPCQTWRVLGSGPLETEVAPLLRRSVHLPRHTRDSRELGLVTKFVDLKRQEASKILSSQLWSSGG